MNKILSIILVFFYISCSGQNTKIYKVEETIRSGKIEGLEKLSKFLDSNKQIVEWLDHHRIVTNEKQIALRILQENSLFLASELKIDTTLNSQVFSNFLTANRDNIKFCKLAESYLITPLTERTIEFNVKSISSYQSNKLKDLQSYNDTFNWITDSIKTMIDSKNPECLLQIASDLYKKRNRFTYYQFNEKEYVELIRKLTNTEIAIPDASGNLSYIFESDFYNHAKLNYLIYWSQNFKNYQWNNQQNIFINKNVQPAKASIVTELFEKLSSENDSIATNAFMQLSLCDTAEVIRLSEEYKRNDIDHNYSLPTFPYRFLPQLVRLVNYCNDNKIIFQSNPEIEKLLIQLQSSKLTFPERYRLENVIIDTLKLSQITAVEYWGLVNGGKWHSTTSLGRVLDVFYSNNWDKIVSNEKELSLYLKKSYLFDRLGIVGVCNLYLRKFKHFNDTIILNKIKSKTSDNDIISQINYISKHYPDYNRPNIKRDVGNTDFYLKDTVISSFEIEFLELAKKGDEFDVIKLVSKTDYSQIGLAINLLKDIAWIDNRCKYDFLDSNFGFPINENDTVEVFEFLDNYGKYSEFDLYKYYILKNGYNIFTENNQLNYEKIYRILKFDITKAFVGGGVGNRYRCIYAIIKLLELTHETNLGFGKKLCQCSCSCIIVPDDRAKAWIEYMFENKLINIKHEPISFND